MSEKRRPKEARGSKLVIEIPADGSGFCAWLEPVPSKIPRTAEFYSDVNEVLEYMGIVLPKMLKEVKSGEV